MATALDQRARSRSDAHVAVTAHLIQEQLYLEGRLVETYPIAWSYSKDDKCHRGRVYYSS
jgi:hypothetical protein